MNPLPPSHYQDGHERLKVTGKRCPECGRVFDSNLFLKGHRATEHDVPDETRKKEIERWREKKRKEAKKQQGAK